MAAGRDVLPATKRQKSGQAAVSWMHGAAKGKRGWLVAEQLRVSHCRRT